jgi:hypothetical protein
VARRRGRRQDFWQTLKVVMSLSNTREPILSVIRQPRMALPTAQSAHLITVFAEEVNSPPMVVLVFR